MKLNWPVKGKYELISCYWEDSKESPYYKKWGWKHNGIDFAVNEGTDLFAIYDMTCTGVNTNESGNWAQFSLDGLNDSGCLYGHLSTFGNLKQGDKFKSGQLLPCKSGNSGYPTYSSGPHLHFGAWVEGYKDPAMGNYSDILGLFLDSETIEVADTKMNPDYGKAYFIKDNKKHWSPDLITFYSYGLVPEDLIRLTETVPLKSTYWLELYKRIKDGHQMEFQGSVHQRLFESMKNHNIINW